MKMNVV